MTHTTLDIFLVAAAFYIIMAFVVSFLQRKWHAGVTFTWVFGIIHIMILWVCNLGYPRIEYILFVLITVPIISAFGDLLSRWILNVHPMIQFPYIYEGHQEKIKNSSMAYAFGVGLFFQGAIGFTAYYWCSNRSDVGETWGIIILYIVFMASIVAQFLFVWSSLTAALKLQNGKESELHHHSSYNTMMQAKQFFIMYALTTSTLILALFIGLIQGITHRHIWALVAGCVLVAIEIILTAAFLRGSSKTSKQ